MNTAQTSMKLSVIIPVYNKADYIEDCLDSLLSQDCDSFEVVAVDDGSTDSSGAICDERAATERRLRVVHTANGGVTAARRTGVEQARGEYIVFVDADDRMAPRGLSTLLGAIERTGADEVVATYDNQRGQHIATGITGWADTEWMIGQLLGCCHRFCILWGVIFRRQLLENCLTAPRVIRAGEDSLMQLLCLLKQPRVYFIPDSVYIYTDGLPNSRRLNIEEQKAYDSALTAALAPEWDRYGDLFTLRQIKMYEEFVCEGQFGVLGAYYRKVRKRLSPRIPLADRIAVMLPPWLAWGAVRLRKWMVRKRLGITASPARGR